jgi:homoserine kinase type II
MLCLRRWPPEYPDPTQLAFIHAVLLHVANRGFLRIPRPVPTTDGGSFVFDDENLWELTNWLPGRADYWPERRPEKLAAAMRALAEWHLAAARFPHAAASEGRSPGIKDRLLQIDRLRSGGLLRLISAIDASEKSGATSPEVIDLARRLVALYPRLEPSVRQKLLAVRGVGVPLQPCIRDVWHDHVLFEDDRVTGFVDFGAVKIESVAGDVARLLNSLAGDDLAAWQQGLAEYSRVRQLSEAELSFVDAFDESLALLSGMNWLDWVLIARRRFDDLTSIANRIRSIVERLEVFLTFHTLRFKHAAGPIPPATLTG